MVERIIINKFYQACEQLNSWLGGYESILKRMTPGNFDWFLHSMLFYHTKHVLKRQGGGDSSDEDSSGEDNSSEDMETDEDD
jgi:hypothetical protein